MPSQVRIKKETTMLQNTSRPIGENTIPPETEGVMRGYTKNTRIANSNPSTPPSLFGIDRRIA